MAQVLVAGQWRSAAFLAYLVKSEVDESAIFDCVEDISDDEGKTPGSTTAFKYADERQGNNPYYSPMDHCLAIEDGTVNDLPSAAPSNRIQAWERRVYNEQGPGHARPAQGIAVAPKAKAKLSFQTMLPFKKLQ
jgi:hypothetical protein